MEEGGGALVAVRQKKEEKQTNADERPHRSTYLHNEIRSDCTPSPFVPSLTCSYSFHLLTNTSTLEFCDRLHQHS